MSLKTLCIPASAIRGKDLARLDIRQLEALAGKVESAGRQKKKSCLPVPVIGGHGGGPCQVICRKPGRGRGYHAEGIPNKLEAAYAEHLQDLLHAGEILFWSFERIRLTLADRSTLLIDFFVVNADGTAEFHDTKGYWQEDARQKIKCAAQQFPCFVFRAVRKDREKGWIYETFYPIGVRGSKNAAKDDL